MSEIDTKGKILDAAEKLFVDNGFSATSLRAIIKEAEVNTAAVHYHFGSKEALIEAVFVRRVDQLNDERLELLDGLESAHGDRPVPLEEVIRAFLDPIIRRHCAGGVEEAIPKLIGRAITEPDSFEGTLQQAFKEVADRFSKAIARALPALSPEEVEWRLNMMVGAMVFTVIAPRIHGGKAHGGARGVEPVELTDRLARFLAAGMRARMPEPTGKEAK